MSQETIQPMETVLFTDIAVQNLNKSRITTFTNLFGVIYHQMGVDARNVIGLRTANRIIINSIKNN